MENETRQTKKMKITKEQMILQHLISTYGKCQKCGSAKNLSLDHIVSIDILRQFGLDVDREIIEDNYQLLCGICNNFKGNRLDFSNSKTKEILIRLLSSL